MPAKQRRQQKAHQEPTAWHIFAKAFASSLVIQGLVTILLISDVVYLYTTGRDVPDGLLTLTGAVMGFWFRSKQSQAPS